MKKSLYIKAYAVIILSLFLLIGCSTTGSELSGDSATAPDTFAEDEIFETSILAFGGGAQAMLVEVMRDITGPPNGVNLLVEYTADTRAYNIAIRAKEYDFYITGWLSIADMRYRGEEQLRIVDAPYVGVAYLYMLEGEDDIDSIDDIKGKRIGIFGNAASTTAQSLKVMLKYFYDIDLERDLEVLYGPPPVVHEALLKGDVDIAVNTPAVLPEMLDSTKFNLIADLSGIWQEAEGHPFLIVGLTTYDELLESNPEGVKSFVKAQREAIQYLLDHPAEAREMMGRITDIQDEKLLQEVTDIYLDSFYTGWNDEVIESHVKFANLYMEMFGLDYLAGIPEDLFTTAFVE